MHVDLVSDVPAWLGLKAMALAWLPRPKPTLGLAWLWPRPWLGKPENYEKILANHKKL
jgi:hypothetical protein